MGFLKDLGRRLYSPLNIRMLEAGSDEVAHAGQPAKVVVILEGEIDESIEAVDLSLVLEGHLMAPKQTWPLGSVPVVLGTHTVDVVLPVGLQPSCGDIIDYRFEGEVRRSKGSGMTALSLLRVIARPEDVFWPDSPRTGGEGSGAEIRVQLDAPTAAIGGTVTGEVQMQAIEALAAADLVVELRCTVDTLVSVAGRSQPQPRVRTKVQTTQVVAPDLVLAGGGQLSVSFRVEIPEDVAPTISNGSETTIVWDVRAVHREASGWSMFALLDPDNLGVKADMRAQTIASLLS